MGPWCRCPAAPARHRRVHPARGDTTDDEPDRHRCDPRRSLRRAHRRVRHHGGHADRRGAVADLAARLLHRRDGRARRRAARPAGSPRRRRGPRGRYLRVRRGARGAGRAAGGRGATTLAPARRPADGGPRDRVRARASAACSSCVPRHDAVGTARRHRRRSVRASVPRRRSVPAAPPARAGASGTSPATSTRSPPSELSGGRPTSAPSRPSCRRCGSGSPRCRRRRP